VKTCRRPWSLLAVVAVAIVLSAAACSAAPERIREGGPEASAPERPRFESRTGVPILMDIPLLGFLFRRTTVVR
jgi:hypothetical protein